MKHYDLWIAFCKEPIYADKGVYNIDQRKEIYFDFCRYGIIPFLGKKGYVLEVSEHELCLRVLKVLWYLKQKRNVIPKMDSSIHEDHYYAYCDAFDHYEWDALWRSWDGIQDFEQSYGTQFKYKLPDLLWSWLDLPSCSKTEEIEQYLYEEEQQEMIRRKDDPYVADHSQIDYQDRHKF